MSEAPSLPAWLDEKRVLVSLLAFSLTILPFSRSISALCGLAMLINLVARGRLLRRVREMYNTKLVAAWGGFFLWVVAGALWSENTEQAWKEIGIAYPLFGMPLLLSLSPRLSETDLTRIMWGIVAGSLAAMATAVYGGWYVYSTYGKPDYFFYHNMVWLLDIPSAIYLSLYIFMATLLLSLHVIRNVKRSHWIGFGLICLLIGVLLASQVLLSVRNTLFLLACIFPFLLYLLLRKVLGKVLSLFGTGVLVVVGIAISLSIPYLRDRISQLLNTNLALAFRDDYLNTDMGLNEINYRLLVWRFSLEGLQHDWLLGVGTGDWRDVLTQRMQAAHVNEVAWGMNAHNQYIHTLFTLGVVGLLLLLLPLVVSLLQGWRQHNIVYLMCLAAFMMSFLTECILIRMHGVLLFATVMCVVAFVRQDENALASTTG